MTLPGTNGFFVLIYQEEYSYLAETRVYYYYEPGLCQYFVTDSVTEDESSYTRDYKKRYVIPYDGLPFAFRMSVYAGPSTVGYYDYKSAMYEILANISPSQIHYRDETMFVFFDDTLLSFVNINKAEISDDNTVIITTVNDIKYECELIDIFNKYDTDTSSSSD